MIGNGTYTNPLTVATAPGEFNECELLYLPYLQKYLIVEDTCASCISDWAKEPKEHHIDVWMESGRGDDPGKVLGCEEGLTPKRGVSVVREPGEEYRVDDSPLWEGGNCLTENTYGIQDVPGCSHVETNGGVQVCFFIYIYAYAARLTGQAPTQESSATRTMARPTTPRTTTSTSTSTSTASTDTDTQQGSGFGMQARLGWVYAIVLAGYFCM